MTLIKGIFITLRGCSEPDYDLDGELSHCQSHIHRPDLIIQLFLVEQGKNTS